MRKIVVFILALGVSTSAYAAGFEAMDSDENGELSDAEFIASYPDKTSVTFIMIDTDHDDTLSEMEIEAAIKTGLLGEN